MKAAVIGIGRVGLPFLAVISKYHEALGLDTNEGWIDEIRNGKQLEEPDLNRYLKKYKPGLSIITSEITRKEIVFIVVGSQSDSYETKQVLSVLEELVPYLHGQIIVITSTMRPGSFKNEILPFLELNGILEKTGGICYSPVLVALGSAIKYFENPGFLVIGGNEKNALEKVSKFYHEMNEDTKVFTTSFENAEVTKFAMNFALINKISLLNLLTEYSERYNADIDFLTEVMKEDPRIAGRKMFKGGLGFGGTCFPLDARAFKKSLNDVKLDSMMLDGIMQVNERQAKRSIGLLRYLPGKISVLGITYKENTNVVEESQALEIAKALSPYKELIIYDPKGMRNARKVLDAKYANSLEEAIKEAKVLFFAVEWPEFLSLKDEDFEGKIVIDPWRMFKGRKIKRYIPYGSIHHE